MARKFLVSKFCSQNFNRDTIEVLIFISKKYPLLKNLNIESESGKVIICNSIIEVILPDFKITTKGVIEFAHQKEITYISFFETKS